MQQIAEWLEKLGMPEYSERFSENKIDVSVLPHLTDQDLKDIGVALGHRRKILAAIAEFAGVAPAASKPVLAAEPKTRDSAERRQVTVLFSDLVGSTALSARMDPEDLREVISAYQKCVAETVQRFGGFVAKYMGDVALVYFGYPQAHEDDAERAVRAGLELVEAVAALKTLCLYRPVSALRLGSLSSAKVAGSEAENVIKIRKGGQVRCNLVGLTDMITHDDLRSTIARHIEEARRMVTEQKGRIARLKATGVDTALAELTLRALEANLKRFQNHSDWSERKKQNPPEPSRVSSE